MTMYAKVIADSIANDIRLTTLELYYPLMIHAQLMTHRMFSRNAQSNRAMPVAKMLEQVINNPAMPSHWGKNQAGMSANEEVNDINRAKMYWKNAAKEAAEFSEGIHYNFGLHKQVANRLTMPFQYIKVIVTATEWDNFFKLRLHDADPTMMELARKMKGAIQCSLAKELKPGEWHLPYINKDMSIKWDFDWLSLDKMKLCSAARCARVSYNNHDNSNPDIEKDLALADRLLRDGHMSPFENIASPMENVKKYDLEDLEEGVTHIDRKGNKWSGNFRGWYQYRQLV